MVSAHQGQGYLEDVTASCATESYALRDNVAVVP